MADARKGLMGDQARYVANESGGTDDFEHRNDRKRLATSGRQSRGLVLWLGRAPSRRLTAECSLVDLEVIEVTRDDIGRMAPYARALVLEVPIEDPTFSAWGSDVLSEAVAHGLCAALVQHEDESDLPRMENEEATRKFFSAVKTLRRDPSRVIALYREWRSVAHWVHEHNPGPGANFRLAIGGTGLDDPASELLFRRAFHDFESLTLDVLSGGKSGASVLRVCPGGADRARRSLPFVVKIHERAKMLAEQSNCFIVKNNVEARLYAPLHTDRCVEGDTLGLVAYDVVERAVPLRAALPMAPETLTASLFGETLRGFRTCSATENRPLASEFERDRLKALKWSDALRDAAARARAINTAIPDVDALRVRISTLPAIPFTVATVHGDLHAGNLFVPSGTNDVLMIDYGAVLQNAPAIADAACLEVSLSFPPIDDFPSGVVPRPSDTWRRIAYKYPLEASSVPPISGANHWIARAVRAVRAQAKTIDPSSMSYGIAVASYLLRFASFDDHVDVNERALAYELACGIVERVSGALDGGKDPAGTNR